MAGLTPTTEAPVINSMLSQIASNDPDPISKTALGIVSSLVSLFGAAHANAVKVEAQTLSAAIPQWRSLIIATINAYNAGSISSSDAIGYIEQAKAVYYAQVKSIQHGTVTPPGRVVGYGTATGSKAPIDPCNGACFLAYYYVEPEASIIEQAFNSGQTVSFTLGQIWVNNTGGGGAPAVPVTISAPPLSGLLPASIEDALPAVVRQNLVWFGLGAIVLLVLAVKR